jgi:metal-responsive CopG/Arc/MetJ family transcriptional regulator
MSAVKRQYEVVSVSLPRDLVRRANAVIPKARRSKVITSMLTTFLDSVERQRLEREYAAYYEKRPKRDEDEERELLNEWRLSDAEAWNILEKEESHDRGTAR